MAPENYLPQNTAPFDLRHELELLRSQLELERSSFLSDWREVGDYILPRRPRFAVTDRNRGGRRNRNIIDSTATLSIRTLRSGMMSGITSPARPWFALSTADPDLSEVAEVKDWLYLVTQRMTTTFLKSNLYNVLPIIYGDIGVFGTGSMFVEEDIDDVVRFYPIPIGSYCIANNEKLQVNVFYREFAMTVRQIVLKFGMNSEQPGKIDWSNISSAVKAMWENKQLEAWVDVRHIVRPNPEYNPKRLESRYKKFQSVYYEAGFNEGGAQNLQYDGLLLSNKGYDYFPVLCPRWEVTGEDVYGTSCPGTDAVGDIKQLQVGERRTMQAVDKMVNPPMVGPTAMRNQKSSLLPGDITYVDERDGQKGFRPAHEVRASVSELGQKQAEIRERIKRAFYEDLFLMLSNSDRREITAREVDERHEEKLLALGPVLEQLNQDLLDPLIDICFKLMLRQNKVPQPPKELHGQQLKIEYLSIMAQAQKLIGIEGVERFAGFAQNVIQANPATADKVDTDKMLEIYGDMTSIPPGIIRTDDQVQAIRDQKQKAAEQQQKMQMLQQGAQTAQTLSQTDTGGDNALTQLMDQAKAGQLEPTR